MGSPIRVSWCELAEEENKAPLSVKWASADGLRQAPSIVEADEEDEDCDKILVNSRCAGGANPGPAV